MQSMRMLVNILDTTLMQHGTDIEQHVLEPVYIPMRLFERVMTLYQA